MAQPPSEGSPYFKVAPGSWSDLDPATLVDIVSLQTLLDSIVRPGVDARPSPLEVALKFNELSTRLFEQIAGDERDIRQVISALRTALAVAWDMHDAVQASRLTVAEHMAQLRDTIESFEADLGSIQHAREAA